MARKRQALRCKSTNRRGLPCGNFAVLGAAVCRIHGGSAPQVRRAARAALNEDLARRMLGSAGGGLQIDSRIGPRSWSPYGQLRACRRERYLADSRRPEIMRDPLLSAAQDFFARPTALQLRQAFAEGYGRVAHSPNAALPNPRQ